MPGNNTPATPAAATTIGGKLQPIRYFTAQVRTAHGDIVGTAFAVDTLNALLVTCKHVVRAASGTCDSGTPLHIYFPLISGETDDKLFPAKVERLLGDGCEDDIVVVRLEARTLPPGVEVAVLSDAARSQGYAEEHAFLTYGFRRLDDYDGLSGSGRIVGFASRSGQVLHGEPVQLRSKEIDSGMSGAAVLDRTRNLVVGVVAETWDSGKRFKDRDTNFAVDCDVLRVVPLNLPLYEGWNLPLTFDRPPDEQARQRAAANPIAFPLPPAYHPAQPPTLDEWVGRVELLDQLDADYRDPATHVTSLIGFGGEGKSSVAYRWVTRILESDPPEAAFWWNFYDNRSFEAMLEEAARYLYGDVADTWKSTAGRVEAIGALLRERRALLVLDGFEVMQEAEGDRYGTLASRDVLRLLELCAEGEHRSFCLVTSRAPLVDLLYNCW